MLSSAENPLSPRPAKRPRAGPERDRDTGTSPRIPGHPPTEAGGGSPVRSGSTMSRGQRVHEPRPAPAGQSHVGLAIVGCHGRSTTSLVAARQEPRRRRAGARESLSFRYFVQSGRPDPNRRRKAWEGDRATVPCPATERYSNGLRPVHPTPEQPIRTRRRTWWTRGGPTRRGHGRHGFDARRRAADLRVLPSLERPLRAGPWAPAFAPSVVVHPAITNPDDGSAGRLTGTPPREAAHPGDRRTGTCAW